MSHAKTLQIHENNLFVVGMLPFAGLYRAFWDLHFTEDSQYYIVMTNPQWAETIDVFSDDYSLELTSEYNLDVDFANSIKFENVAPGFRGFGRVWHVQ